MEKFTLTASDACAVACYRWLPPSPARGVLHIAHGMGEHAQRYDTVARDINRAGYAVYANDHRGHGETGAAALGHMGPDGWNRVLADAYELNRLIATAHPGLPIALLGHSMGAMLAQQYVTRHGASISALALSGSPGFKAASRNPLPGWILRFENRRVGPSGSSPLMQKLLFGDANKAFAGPDASGFEWLSRDREAVRRYVADPACGFVLSTASLLDLYAGSVAAQADEGLALIPRDLPILIFSGTEDPVHNGRADIQRMVLAYTQLGIKRLTVKWYDGGRHEMFNETNRAEVVADVSAWLDSVVLTAEAA